MGKKQKASSSKMTPAHKALGAKTPEDAARLGDVGKVGNVGKVGKR